MVKQAAYSIEIWVYADWVGPGGTALMGTLNAERFVVGKVMSFAYSKDWLEYGSVQVLDAGFGIYAGLEYTRNEKPNAGSFPDFSPERRAGY